MLALHNPASFEAPTLGTCSACFALSQALTSLFPPLAVANGGHIIGTDDAYVEGADYVIATHEQQALVQQTREAQAAGAAACVFGPQWVLACVDEGQLVEANVRRQSAGACVRVGCLHHPMRGRYGSARDQRKRPKLNG